ncbi:MAG: ATPase, T2SS/T4P/T4SS family [Candidatus Omnitrophica bacterium]|nr:ATPase, T2SS/T4P/T4SS family [Candidatus Omnitrophota bacterium]
MSKNIVIFSTKGGVGKTLVATNLAVSLARDQGQRVCLIDLDVQAPQDMARMLNLNPNRSMADIMSLLKKPAQSFKKTDFLTQNLFGIDFLAGVLKPQQSPYIDPAKLKDVFSLLEKDYDYIVVDAGKSFSEIFVATLNQANLLLLMLTPDVISIYQTKWILDTLQFLHFPLSMMKAVLNRAESLAGISWQEVKVSLPIDILSQIPSEGKIVGLSVNRGVPVVLENPKSKISSAIKQLSNTLVTEKELFTERKDIDQIKLKQLTTQNTGAFWQNKGMGETPSAIDLEERDRVDEIINLKRRTHARLIDQLDIKRLDLKLFSDHVKTKELRARAEVMVTNLMVEEAGSFISSPEMRKKLVKEIVDEALGLGPLEDLLADPEITDIMVNNKNEIYVERFGKLELTSKKFISNEQVRTIIERIIAPIGRRIDESVPMVDARLPDGSRVNAIISPLALTGPTLTIRKFRKEKFKVEELISFGSLNQAMADFIKACVLLRKNTIVSGGTGSGKTTVLNVLSTFIPSNERIVTIEDAAELKLNQEHWVRLESRPPNIEGRGAITIRDLFRNTLRMRPDRIIVGECRGLETLDMLQAMNTGHDGSMTTIHANSTHDVITRMDSMILMSGVELPIRSIREMVASAVDIIVHTARLSDGSRKVTQITEIAGMKDESHVDLKDIFIFKRTGIGVEKELGRVLGNFSATGYKPSFFEEFKINGIPFSEALFKPS